MATAITTALLLIAGVILTAWDVYVALGNKIPNSKDTISGQFKAVGGKLRGFPFMFGVLGGHFFWGGSSLIRQPFAALAITALTIIVSMPPLRRIPMIVVMLGGVIVGRLLWPQ